MRATVYRFLVRAVAPLLILMALAIVPRTAAAQVAQPEGQAVAQPAGAPEAGGEANLKLPDLSTVEFHGINGRTLLGAGLVVCVLGLLFGLMTLKGIKKLTVQA